MVALALSLLFPTVPVSILVLCIESAAVGLLLGAPLTAILLVAVVGTYDPYSIVLMCLSTGIAMFVGAGFKRLLAQRAAGKWQHPPDEDWNETLLSQSAIDQTAEQNPMRSSQLSTAYGMGCG